MLEKWYWYIIFLLHIMCGYQCDKAVNKNDTREVVGDSVIRLGHVSFLN